MDSEGAQVVFLALKPSRTYRRCADILGERSLRCSRHASLELLLKARAGGPDRLPYVIAVESSGPLSNPRKLVETVKQLRENTMADILVLGEQPTAEAMLDVVSAGAYEYLPVSDARRDTDAVCKLMLDICDERKGAPQEEKPVFQSEPRLFLGRSPKILAAVTAAAKALKEDAVLFQGETGAGKSFMVKAVLRTLFPERSQPFVHVDCGAFTESLIEAQLFGWQAGTFTGSGKEDRPGLFELADRGVLFLDEIGNLPLEQQNVLLMALESNPEEPFRKTIRRTGVKEVPVDVQVVCATQYDLREMIGRGQFSEALYYRISRYSVAVAPLRERPEDISYLAQRFLCAHSLRMKKRFAQISPQVMELLKDYCWPGNVRELSNVIAAAVRMHRGRTLKVEHLPEFIANPRGKAASRALYGEALLWLKKGVDRKERARLAREFGKGEAELSDGARFIACDLSPGDLKNPAELARRLGVSRSTVWKRLQEEVPFTELWSF